jgi:hypothetical protein
MDVSVCRCLCHIYICIYMYTIQPPANAADPPTSRSHSGTGPLTAWRPSVRPRTRLEPVHAQGGGRLFTTMPECGRQDLPGWHSCVHTGPRNGTWGRIHLGKCFQNTPTPFRFEFLRSQVLESKKKFTNSVRNVIWVDELFGIRVLDHESAWKPR